MNDYASNPFPYGDLALGDSFAARRSERAALAAAMRDGEDVVVIGRRRLGRSSLIWNAAQAVAPDGVLVVHVNLMTTPSKERLAAALVDAIEEIGGAAPLDLGFNARTAEVDVLLERLLRLPGEMGAERGRRVALIVDEFQQVAEIDPGLPDLMRSVFQRQAEVSHVYSGCKPLAMERIFGDGGEPFWRSANPIELGPIEPAAFAPFVAERFAATGKRVAAGAIAALLELTGGHPYATQQLCSFLWQRTGAGEEATTAELELALTDVLRSEHTHFLLLWEGCSPNQRLVIEALAREPGRPFRAEYRRRHDLGPATNVQRALKSLEQREIAVGEGGAYRLAEPFLAEWLV
ncbi:MAG: hypothetical protein R2725_16330 [Solirubrobacterales bacterium]